ncbi:MAG: hypothetical protein LBV47_01830 [Bacteroidales bacterium]|nr:hypothetical protein [Bacteroidales bacterium]
MAPFGKSRTSGGGKSRDLVPARLGAGANDACCDGLRGTKRETIHMTVDKNN